jgi:hypothetical protein
LWKAFWLGMRMILLVLEYRFGLHQKPRQKWTPGLRPVSLTDELTALHGALGASKQSPFPPSASAGDPQAASSGLISQDGP